MNEQVCTKAVDTCGYPVETTGNAVLDTLEHRSSRVPSRVMTTTAPWR